MVRADPFERMTKIGWKAESLLADWRWPKQTYLMAIFKQRRAWWGLANALGLTTFLAFASRAWIEPELANEPGASAGVTVSERQL